MGTEEQQPRSEADMDEVTRNKRCKRDPEYTDRQQMQLKFIFTLSPSGLSQKEPIFLLISSISCFGTTVRRSSLLLDARLGVEEKVLAWLQPPLKRHGFTIMKSKSTSYAQVRTTNVSTLHFRC